MKKLNKLQNTIFFLGGMMLMAGSVLFLFEPVILAPAIFSAGAVFYVLIQWMQGYEGDNIRIIRLRKIQMFSGFMILLSAALMISNRWVYDIYTIFKLDIYNMWIAVLLAAAILQFYTILKIDKELLREEKKM